MGVLGLMLLICWVCNFIGMIFPTFRMSLRLHGSNKFLLFFIFLYYFVDRPSPVQAPNGKKIEIHCHPRRLQYLDRYLHHHVINLNLPAICMRIYPYSVIGVPIYRTDRGGEV